MEESASKGPTKREQAKRRAAAARRRKAMRRYLILGIVLALIGAVVAFSSIRASKQREAANRIAETADCTKVQDFEATGSGIHLDEGGTVPNYETKPPTHGPHAGTSLNARIYETPFLNEVPTGNSAPAITQAVHSLEHGYVAVWYKDLESEDVATLTSAYEGSKKVIVVPYPELEGRSKIALTAWGRLQTCREMKTEVIDYFIKQYRESRKAPERFGP